MDVTIDAGGGQNSVLAGQHFGACAYHHTLRHSVRDVGVSGLADGHDPAVFDPDVAFHDTGVVEDKSVRDQKIEGFLLQSSGALPHAVAKDLAASELALLTVNGVVEFHLDDEIGVAQANPIPCGGTEHIHVGPTIKNFTHAVISFWANP